MLKLRNEKYLTAAAWLIGLVTWTYRIIATAVRITNWIVGATARVSWRTTVSMWHHRQLTLFLVAVALCCVAVHVTLNATEQSHFALGLCGVVLCTALGAAVIVGAMFNHDHPVRAR